MPELATKYDLLETRAATTADIAELRHLIKRQTLALTVRLGGLIVAGVGALAAFRYFS